MINFYTSDSPDTLKSIIVPDHQYGDKIPDHYSIFLYKDLDTANIQFIIYSDMHKNPIDNAIVYHPDALWRVIFLPPIDDYT